MGKSWREQSYDDYNDENEIIEKINKSKNFRKNRKKRVVNDYFEQEENVQDEY